MEENNKVKLEEKVDNSSNVECKHKQKNNKLAIWFGVAIAILACIGAFFLGQSLAKNENSSSEGNENKEEVKEETKPKEELPKEEDTVVEPEEDVFEPYSYKANCKNIDKSYIVDVDVSKYDNIVDYINEQENIEIEIDYCVENMNDINGDEPYLIKSYMLTDSEEKKVLDEIKTSKHSLVDSGLGGVCSDSLDISYERNGKKYEVSFYGLFALSSNDGNIYAILDKGKSKKEFCNYEFENLSPTAKAILNTVNTD